MHGSLADRLDAGPTPVSEFLELSVALAESLAQFHAGQALHGAITPKSILWDEEKVCASFGPPAERSSQGGLEGSLEYLSPEQTGRTARGADHRSDLYALGAIYYELLVGRPPFGGGDRLELIHAHLARRPAAPHELRPGIPTVLSDIVLKLLAKAPEQRYQAAAALAADLREARTRLAATGTIEPFVLASNGELRIPETLYARSRELAVLPQLVSALVAGSRSLVLLTGAPGVGKTALANELAPLVAQTGGFFAAGKFDQLSRSTPYSALVQALRSLVRHLLAQPEAELSSWKERIQQAIAPNGQLLVDVIPDLSHLLGPQPPAQALGPVESKNRFSFVFQSFIRVLAQKRHPLVLFLDDLQWVDASSLELVRDLVSESDIASLAIVAAYRDTEVDAAHPVALTLAALHEAGAPIQEMHVAPLDATQVTALLADTLAGDSRRLRGLAQLLVRKTGGNPFFLRQMLRSLQAEGWIRLDASRRTWEFDLAAIERAAITDNVIELMVRAIDRMPQGTRELLKLLSCIGNRAELATVAAVSRRSIESAREGLSPAMERGLLVAAQDGAAPVVQFVHDRVQQAAYSLVADGDKPALHLEVGRLLLKQASPQALQDALFDVVDQLNRGERLIFDAAERAHAAELNLQAGRKAKASAAYDGAFTYFAFGATFMGADRWQTRVDLAFDLCFERAESAYLTGRHELAEELVEEALAHAPSRVAQAELYALRVLAATVAGDYARALRWGNQGLRLFGLEWPREGFPEAIEAEAAAIMTHLGDRRIEDLAGQPAVSDEETVVCMRLLSMLGPPAYFSFAFDVLQFVMMRLVNLSLVRGPSAYSAYGYTFYGALHNGRTGDYETGHAFGRLALLLARRFGHRGEESRTLEVFGLIVNPWKAPLRSNVALFKEGYRAGVEYGELQYAAYNLVALLMNGLPLGVVLPEFLKDIEAAHEFSRKHKNKTVLEIAIAYRQGVRSLTGLTRTRASFEDDDFDEARYLDDARDNLTAHAFYWVIRLQAAYLFEDHAGAAKYSEAAAKVLASAMGMVIEAEHVFYSALTVAALCERAPEHERSALLEQLRVHQARLSTWAGHCPENFLHKARLVDAEMARVRGAPLQARRFYEEALEQAKREGFVHEEALAAELAGRFYLRSAQPRTATRYLRDARDAYQRWGATAKVEDLERAHPELATVNQELQLDALGLIKASQAISAETVPQRLFERILQIILEVAGARSGALVLDVNGTATVRARASVEGTVSVEDVALSEAGDLPRALLRYGLRVGQPLLLRDAGAEGEFAGDPEVRALQLRSVLCVPMREGAASTGLLYLENGALRDAFPAERVEVVRALAAQAAISLERKRAEDALREADRRKDEFLATLAHELRNPLAPLRNSLELMKLEGAGGAARDIMERQVNHLVRLVDDLLEISRITRGTFELRKERVELSAVVRNAVETAEPLIRAGDHRLSVSLPPEPLILDGDPVRLAQILANLLNNAAKYTDAGGHINIEARRQDGAAVVSVRDDGAGIAPELLPRVFEMFNRGGRTVGPQGGLGIGLSLSRRLTEMHGGTIEAKSAGRDGGAEFTVRLPLAPHTARRHGDGAHGLNAAISQKRILIVDDNRDAAESLRMILTFLGADVQVANDGPQALAAFETYRPSVVLLDIGMPGMDGYQVARSLRQRQEGRRIPIVAVTGYGQEEDKRRARDAGFDHHLVKPAEIGTLRALLSALPPAP